MLTVSTITLVISFWYNIIKGDNDNRIYDKNNSNDNDDIDDR